MPQTFVDDVEPIRPTFDAVIGLAFTQAFWDEMELGTGRLVAQFRHSLSEPVVFTADSAAGSLVRTGQQGISITIPAAVTTTFERHVVFDLARIDGDEKRSIPGRVQWPVERSVTRDV